MCGEFTGPGEFPAQSPVTRSFDVFFDLHLNKRLSKQPWGWWFETPSWSLWRHYDVIVYRWHAPYQGPKSIRSWGNPGLLHSHTQLYCRIWRIIHVTDMNGHPAPGVFYGVYNWTLGWPIHDLHVMLLQEILCGSGCVQRSIILDQSKVVVEGSSCPALETFLAEDASLFAGSWCRSVQPAHVCRHREIQRIRWRMTGITICSLHKDINVLLTLLSTHLTSSICVMQMESWLISEDKVSPVADIPNNTMTTCPLTTAPTMH